MKTKVAAFLIVLSLCPGGCVLIGYDSQGDRDASPGGGGRDRAGAGAVDGATPADSAGRGPGRADGGPHAGAGGGGQGDAGDAAEGQLPDAAEQPAEPYCLPNESFCDGDEFVVCDGAAEVESREDCALVEGHDQQCRKGGCDPDTGCELGNAENLSACEDGLFCTVGEHCKEGVCGWGSQNTCESAASACRVGVCNEEADRCDTEPGNPGGPCGSNATCDAQGVCVGGGEPCAGVECAISCEGRVSPCALSCAGALFCQATCSAGASCSVDCGGTEEGCQVRCVQGSLCDIDCSGQALCGPIKCEAGAQCILRCDAQSDACGFTECVGADAEWCAESSAWVCHRPCP